MSGVFVRDPQWNYGSVVDSKRVMQLHRGGYRWLEIASILGVGRATVYEAAKDLGIGGDALDWRRALPAGSPRTWGVINAGLATLEGARFDARLP
jgi:hypothetical protein